MRNALHESISSITSFSCYKFRFKNAQFRKWFEINSKLIQNHFKNLASWPSIGHFNMKNAFSNYFESFLRDLCVGFWNSRLYFEIWNFCRKFKQTVLSENWLEKIGSASKFSPSHWIIFFDVCWQWLSMITGERAVPHIPSWHSLNKTVISCSNRHFDRNVLWRKFDLKKMRGRIPRSFTLLYWIRNKMEVKWYAKVDVFLLIINTEDVPKIKHYS